MGHLDIRMGRFLPVSGQAIYGAAKAAVKLITEGLPSKLSNTIVRVTVVLTGAIGTNTAANSSVGHTVNRGNEIKQRSIKPLAPSKVAQIIIDGIEKHHYQILV